MSSPLRISKISPKQDFLGYGEALQALPKHFINQVNWADDYPSLPLVYFQIAHTGQSIVLQYHVQEQEIRAEYKIDNQPVYKDSCVEFFLSFDRLHYYNFEFNAIGTALLGYGSQKKESRQRHSSSLLRLIRRHSIIDPVSVKGDEQRKWSLLVEIPVSVLNRELFSDLSGISASANFYKCGDNLTVPHYVSWKRIEAPQPDFHLPGFFGQVIFE